MFQTLRRYNPFQSNPGGSSSGGVAAASNAYFDDLSQKGQYYESEWDDLYDLLEKNREVKREAFDLLDGYEGLAGDQQDRVTYLEQELEEARQDEMQDKIIRGFWKVALFPAFVPYRAVELTTRPARRALSRN